MQAIRLAFVIVAVQATLAYGLQSTLDKQVPFRPVAGVRDIMKGIVEPLTRTVFASVGTIISSNGVTEIAPQTEEEWDAVRSAAMGLAEAGNLLMFESRARDKDTDWIKMSQLLVARSVEAANAAKDKNPDRLLISGGELYEVCESCHGQYMTPVAWQEWRWFKSTPCAAPLRILPEFCR